MITKSNSSSLSVGHNTHNHKYINLGVLNTYMLMDYDIYVPNKNYDVIGVNYDPRLNVMSSSLLLFVNKISTEILTSILVYCCITEIFSDNSKQIYYMSVAEKLLVIIMVTIINL